MFVEVGLAVQLLKRGIERIVKIFLATEFLDFGQPENSVVDRVEEIAAFTTMASMIFNLDEAMTHE